MDYAGGTDLWKYQWDLIHNPERILFSWGQDEEEGASTNLTFPRITFFKQASQKYGFDKNDIQSVADYNQKNIFAGSTYEVPWQMIRLNYTGIDNNINIEVRTNRRELCNQLFFIPDNEIISDGLKPSSTTAVQIIGSNHLAITPNSKTTHNVSIMGMDTGVSGFQVVKDSINGDLVGAINIITSVERTQNVFIVTVHLNKTGQLDTSVVANDLRRDRSSYLSSYVTPQELLSISKTANEIYNQALLNVNFTLFNTYEHKFTNAICLDFDLDNDRKINAKSTTGFTTEQELVISNFKKYSLVSH